MTAPHIDPVIAEVTVAAPVDVVWPALREPAEIRRWFGWDYPGLDDEIEVIFAGGEAREADYVLDLGEGGLFELVPELDGQTVVRVSRPLPAGAESWEGVYDVINEGWLTFIQQLRFALERHRGRDRRTVRLSGVPRDTDAEPPDPNAVLGLAGTPSFSDGRVWFASDYQLGLILPDRGDSLLVVGLRPETDPDTDDEAPAVASAVVNTYGLSDAEFAELRDLCVERWQAHYTDEPATK